MKDLSSVCIQITSHMIHLPSSPHWLRSINIPWIINPTAVLPKRFGSSLLDVHDSVRWLNVLSLFFSNTSQIMWNTHLMMDNSVSLSCHWSLWGNRILSLPFFALLYFSTTRRKNRFLEHPKRMYAFSVSRTDCFVFDPSEEFQKSLYLLYTKYVFLFVVLCFFFVFFYIAYWPRLLHPSLRKRFWTFSLLAEIDTFLYNWCFGNTLNEEDNGFCCCCSVF